MKINFQTGSKHLNINESAGHYAWKPVVVADTLRETAGMLLWLDAGNLVHCKLHRIRAIMAEHGVYSPVSSDNVARWTHPATLRYLGAPPAFLHRLNRSGGIVGLNANHEGVTQMAEMWKSCALDVNCIAPPGSNRDNHRQDQAILTVLMYNFQARHGCALVEERLDISWHNDHLTLEEVERMLGPE